MFGLGKSKAAAENAGNDNTKAETAAMEKSAKASAPVPPPAPPVPPPAPSAPSQDTKQGRFGQRTVWGIDVGNCALKAMRCYVDEKDPSKLVADAIDYIEYPQILTQPDANADELIRDALKQFLERNDIRGSKIAISIAGQNGFVRFIKLPPVPAKKIPDLVLYEAKQQIPFPLPEVIWDYQRIGQQSDDAFGALEIEIGLFSIKRDQMFRILEPYEDQRIPVDIVQLGPLALYNYMMRDEVTDLPSADEYDPDNPPPYTVILSMGTDATDLILTNGFHVWQRNLPIGGNHFTKALVKDLNLTFAKADHLKRNLTTSQDKIAVLRAMQPVFNNFQNEIQRSLSFHSNNIDSNAQYDHIIALGSSMRLTGLTKYLSQNLGIRVELGSSFKGLDTSNLKEQNIVRDYLPSFGVCYGLCLQGLKESTLQTNFLPSEIRTSRIINSKKPWAVAAMALLLLCAMFNYGANVRIQSTVAQKNWQSAESSASGVAAAVAENTTKVTSADEAVKKVDQFGAQLVANSERRLLWLELLRGINECLPEVKEDKGKVIKEAPTSDSIRNREELHITNIDAQQVSSSGLELWFQKMVTEGWFTKEQRESLGVLDTEAGENASVTSGNLTSKAFTPGAPGMDGGIPGAPQPMPAAPTPDASGDGEASAAGPERWIISVSGYHFHNGNGIKPELVPFVQDTFIHNLETKEFDLPKTAVLSKLNAASKAGADQASERVTMKELGLSYPVLINPGKTVQAKEMNPYKKRASDNAGSGGSDSGTKKDAKAVEAEENVDVEEIPVDRFDFVVHFVWEPKTPAEREAARKLKEQQKQEQALENSIE